MKIKSMIASLAACTIAVSAMAISASAEKTILNANADANYKVDVADKDVDNIAGIKAEITMADGWTETGAGGGLIFNSDKDNGGTGWQQVELGITGEGADAKNTEGVTISGSDGKFTITYQTTKGNLSSKSSWNELLISNWWGSDFTVDSLIALDESGNEIGAKPADATTKAPVETTKASEDTTKATTAKATTTKAAATTKAGTTTAASTKTGDAGVGVAVAGLSLAAVAAFVARKKH